MTARNLHIFGPDTAANTAYALREIPNDATIWLYAPDLGDMDLSRRTVDWHATNPSEAVLMLRQAADFVSNRQFPMPPRSGPADLDIIGAAPPIVILLYYPGNKFVELQEAQGLLQWITRSGLEVNFRVILVTQGQLPKSSTAEHWITSLNWSDLISTRDGVTVVQDEGPEQQQRPVVDYEARADKELAEVAFADQVNEAQLHATLAQVHLTRALLHETRALREELRGSRP